MKRLIFGDDDNICKWVAGNIPHVKSFSNAAAIGVSDGCKIIAGVVYHDYVDRSVQMSVASIKKNWLTSGSLSAFFRYPFIQLDCIRVTALTPEKNIKTRKFLENLGFIQEGKIRKGFVTDHCLIYGLLREECRFLKE